MKVLFDPEGDYNNYSFRCPGCGKLHVLYVTKTPEIPSKLWTFNGDFDKPSFQPSQSNYYPEEFYQKHPYTPRYICHFTITDGIIDFHDDCTHEKKNTKMELPEYNGGK